MPLTDDAVISIVDKALAELAPITTSANLVQIRVVRHPRATFVSAPGSAEARPAAATPISGLTLAGDWTQTGWPSTLESAVRSGVAAAARLNLESDADDQTEDAQ
jgi:uncharacterized protein with NAD-binding domain and iron-sulfur cluster